MTGFFENTWFVWWVLAVVIILRWFHGMQLSETTEVEIDRAQSKEKAGVAA